MACALLIGGCWTAFKIDDYRTFGTERFSYASWHKERTREEQFGCFRGAMAHDVRDTVLKSGMSRTEVESRLGPPDMRGGGYILGLCTVWDVHSLQLKYDATGRLLNSRIVQN